MRDFLPEDVRRRRHVIGVIADVYQQYGFEPLETPAVENLETLQGKYGEEGDRLIFKILKRGEGAETGQADLALRYDLTVPLARVVAEYRARLPKFFKRYQVQPVWRADRPQKGRFREFYQCDVDAIGSKSMLVEAELLAAAADVLARLGFADFTIRLNHRQLLAAMLRKWDVATEGHAAVLVALDKLDKVGIDGVTAELVSQGIPIDKVGAMLGLVQAYDSYATPLEFLEFLDQQLPDAVEAIGELREILKLSALTSAAGKVRLDLFLARGLGYYTGAIFEIAVPDLAGSLGGGGRYDNLIGMFSGEHVPACGISLGLERILVVMAERNMFPASLVASPADVMVVQWFAHRTDLYLALATELRAAGLRVELYPEAPADDNQKGAIVKQFQYAQARGIPFAAVIGTPELEAGTVTIRTLATRQDEQRPRAELAAYLKTKI
jgi:histidyl-tRNA synthetase